MNATNPSRILITAGATHEPMDCVRFISNRSSGQLGVLLGLAAAKYGHDVTLLLGPDSVTPTSHPRLITIPFTSARDVSAKLHEVWPSHGILIMAAAVADFTPKGGQTDGKFRRGDPVSLELTPTKDIVAGLAKEARADQHVICFALEESEVLEEAAIEKMKRKKVDAIVANPLETMDAKTITAQIFCNDGRRLSPPKNIPKSHFATWLIEHLDDILSAT